MKTRTLGPCKVLDLNGNELATAIDSYIVAHNVHVGGPRTIRIIHEGDPDDTVCRSYRVEVIADPSGKLHSNATNGKFPVDTQTQLENTLAELRTIVAKLVRQSTAATAEHRLVERSLLEELMVALVIVGVEMPS